MEHYKQLNKELVEQIQILKVENASYRREIVLLREQLFEEHRKKIEDKDTAVELLTNTFWSALKIIEPNVRLSKLFNKKVKSLQQDDCEVKPSNAITHVRHSSELSKELRRSSSIQQRKSMVSVSPIQRRSSQKYVNTVDRRSEEQLDESTCVTIDGSSTEEDCEETNDNDRNANDQIADDQNVSTNKTTIEVQLDVINETNESINKSTTSSASSVCSPQINQSTTSSSASACSPLIGTRRGKKIANIFSDDSIPTTRFVLSTDSLNFSNTSKRKSLIISPDMDISDNSSRKIQCTSPSTSTLIDFTLQNFENAASSTPRGINYSNVDTARRRSVRLVSQSAISTTLENTTEGRPRRKCTPQNLKEPTLNSKLRNNGISLKKSKK